MRIIIVRHGEPNYEIDSLTEKGWKEAELASRKLQKLNIDNIYVSPLGRAKDNNENVTEDIDTLNEIRDEIIGKVMA